MKTIIALSSGHLFRAWFLSAAACFLAVLPARAGLTVDVHLYHNSIGYYFYPFLSTNTTLPGIPLGDYVIASPQIPNGGSELLYQATTDGTTYSFNGIGGGGSYYYDFDSFLYGITNGQWSITVTNATSTNYYYFTVTVTGITSNSLGAPVMAAFPTNGEVYVTNQPLFSWTGPANWAGGLYVQDSFIDTNGNSFYQTSAGLTPDQTSWPCPAVLPDGINDFYVDYSSNVTAMVVASTPTDDSAQPISGWISTANMDNNFAFDPQFTVGVSSAGNFTAGHTNVAYYSFEDDNLFAQDFSGNGNDIGSYSWFGAPPYMTNDAEAGNYAVGYTGSGWQNPPTNLVATLAGSFSVSLWVKTSDDPGNDSDTADQGEGLLSANADQVIPMALTGSKLAFLTGGGTLDTLHSVTSINTGSSGNYVHVVVTRDSVTGQKKIYVNGNLDAFDFGSTGQLGTGSNPTLLLGMNSTFSGGLTGEMDEVQIYSGVLSVAEVNFLYNHPATNSADIAGPGEVNLVSNGGFETGDFTGWNLITTDGSIFVDNGSGSPFSPHSGTYDAVFGTVGSPGYINQTLSTAPGATYLITFALNSPDGSPPNEFQVSWDGTTVFDQTDIPGIGWTNIQLVVTATGASTVLQFDGRDDPSYLGLDDVSVIATQPVVTPDFGAALNASNLTWTTGGDAGWFVETTNTYDGVSAAQSGAISINQNSWIQTTVPYDGQISFYWKVSSEPDHDYLNFYINGVEQNQISGEVDWNQQTYSVSAGDTLQWEYTKDASSSAGLDAGWLDEVQYLPSVSASFDLQIERYASLASGYTNYSAFPHLNYVSPAPVTTNSVVSPDGFMFSEVWPGYSNEKNANGESFNTLDEAIYACTNGLWTLYINRGDPSQQTFHFSVSINGLDTNVLSPANILVPANNAVNVATNSPFLWSGPANYSYVFIEAYQINPSFAFDGYAFLPGNATSWPAPPALLYGTNFFYVQIGSNSFPNVTFTTPVDSGMNPISSWTTEADLQSAAFSTFVVGAPAPLPVQLISAPPQADNNFQFSFQTLAGRPEIVQVTTNLTSAWIDVSNFIGDGSIQQFTFPTTNTTIEFFRVETQ